MYKRQVYGFGPSIKYKNLDFSLFFQGTGRVSLMTVSYTHLTNTTKISLGLNVSVRDWSGPYSCIGCLDIQIIDKIIVVDIDIVVEGVEVDVYKRQPNKQNE